LHNLAPPPFIFSIASERKTPARSFYIGSRQNYRQAQWVAGERWDTISMKRKHLRLIAETGAFGIQTVYRNAGL
jgi:hypothetical protein